MTGNAIQEIEDGAFAKLVLLEELSLADNRIAKLPVLPPKLTSLNLNNNRIKSRGIKANAFKVKSLLSTSTTKWSQSELFEKELLHLENKYYIRNILD